jgi:hypothetical protein
MGKTSMILIPLLSAFLCLLYPVNSLAYPNEPDGFREILWGTDIQTLANMAVAEKDGDDIFYSRTGDNLLIAGATIDQIHYGFYKGKFYSVIIRFQSRRNFLALKERLMETYGGVVLQQNPNQHDYKWGMLERFLGVVRLVQSKTVINLVYDEKTGKGHIAYLYRPIADRINQGEASVSTEVHQ